LIEFCFLASFYSAEATVGAVSTFWAGMLEISSVWAGMLKIQPNNSFSYSKKASNFTAYTC